MSKYDLEFFGFLALVALVTLVGLIIIDEQFLPRRISDPVDHRHIYSEAVPARWSPCPHIKHGICPDVLNGRYP